MRDATLEARFGKHEAARRLRAQEEATKTMTTGTTIPAGFWVGAGIPKGERVNTFIECGCCGAYHRTDFYGDCREDSERHWELPDDAVIVATECEECGHPLKDGDETHYPGCGQIEAN